MPANKRKKINTNCYQNYTKKKKKKFMLYTIIMNNATQMWIMSTTNISIQIKKNIKEIESQILITHKTLYSLSTDWKKIINFKLNWIDNCVLAPNQKYMYCINLYPFDLHNFNIQILSSKMTRNYLATFKNKLIFLNKKRHSNEAIFMCFSSFGLWLFLLLLLFVICCIRMLWDSTHKKTKQKKRPKFI